MAKVRTTQKTIKETYTCEKYFKYILEGMKESDEEFNHRIEEVSLKEDISNKDYCEIYSRVMEVYKSFYSNKIL